MSKITIRKAELEDADRIFELVNRLESDTLDEKEFSQIFSDNIQNPDIHYLVATDDDRIVGFISLHIQNLLHHTGKAAEINEFVIDEELRGEGIGEQLIEYARDLAKGENCKVFEVCCNRKRRRAHKFYQKKGHLEKTHYKFTQKI